MTTEARHLSAETRTSERGFTLIELSIVLVIIGLLIGGILQGQEMINNTRLKTTVAQTDAIQAAVQTFQDKFGALPGDFSRANILGGTAPTSNAFGDGIIAAATSGNASLALTGNVTVSSEAALVFNHLDAANLLQGVDNTGTGQTSSTMPARLDGGAFDVVTFTYATSSISDGVGIRIRGGTGAAAAPILVPRDAFSFDEKYDDGAPLTGRWQSPAGTSNACHNAGTWAAGDAAACMTVISIR